jgi:hypothetical protein
MASRAVTDPADVVGQIRDAFRDVPLPRPELLYNGHCDECVEVSEAFGGRPWQDVPLDDVLYQETAVLTVAAWRYYLPAVMIWCLTQPERVDVMLDNIVFQLNPSTSVPEFTKERAVGFSPAQRSAIVAFLRWRQARLAEQAQANGCLASDETSQAISFWSADDL